MLVSAVAGLMLIELDFFHPLLYYEWLVRLLGSKLHGGTIGRAPHSYLLGDGDLLSGGVCFSQEFVATKIMPAGHCMLLMWYGFLELLQPSCSTLVNKLQ